MDRKQLKELILQSLEHERGGVQVYETAVAVRRQRRLTRGMGGIPDQTRSHVQILEGVCRKLELDPEEPSPGRQIVHDLGASLVAAMRAAQDAGNPAAAQLVACECVVLAETKDHADWELLGKCAEKLSGEQTKALTEACEEVEDQEDEHLYHTKGWCRELWLESLGCEPCCRRPRSAST